MKQIRIKLPTVELTPDNRGYKHPFIKTTNDREDYRVNKLNIVEVLEQLFSNDLRDITVISNEKSESIEQCFKIKVTGITYAPSLRDIIVEELNDEDTYLFIDLRSQLPLYSIENKSNVYLVTFEHPNSLN